MSGARNLMTLVGRFLVAIIFLLSGFGKLTNMSGTAGYMTQAGMAHSFVYPALLDPFRGLAVRRRGARRAGPAPRPR